MVERLQSTKKPESIPTLPGIHKSELSVQIWESFK